MKKKLCCLLIILCYLTTHAQFTRFLVQLKNKGNNPFSISNPTAYLSQRAIDRRIRYSIDVDSTDLPVTPSYIDSIRLAGTVTILNASKWLNSVTILTSDAAALNKINTLSFVKSVSPIAAGLPSGRINKFQIEKSNYETSGSRIDGLQSFYNYGLSLPQIHIHNGEFLHDIGLRGETMIIGMLDAGFYNYTSLHAFDSVNANGQILGIYDFVAHDNSVVEDDAHGMECFSTIAANIPGTFVGTAPKASFYLFRTEDVASEYPIEEHNWVCGAEKLDSAGSDVISSSLGYNQFDSSRFDHVYSDMNGHTTIAAIGAAMAAKKGILVLNAAGNEGDNAWHYIITPADADSILAVGAVTTSGTIASFSSYGPSADGRIKPDVVSVGQGTIIESTGNTVVSGNGTSFACPNMAGLATCLWEGFQEFNNIKIIHALQQAGSMANIPDNHAGYGIPDVKKAVMNLLKDFATSNATFSNCTVQVNWTSKDTRTMKYEIERKLPVQTSFFKIAELYGSSVIFTNHSYSYSDTLVNAQTGIAAYRIKEFIDTSSVSSLGDYIDTATVSINSSCITTGTTTPATNNGTIYIMPNPSDGNSQLIVDTPDYIELLSIKIVDMLGRVVYTLNTSKGYGKVSIPLDLTGLAKSKYLISVYNKGLLMGTKVLLRL